MAGRCDYRFIIDPRRQLDSDGAILVTTPEELYAAMQMIDQSIADHAEAQLDGGEAPPLRKFEILIQPAQGQTQALFNYSAECVREFMERQPVGTTTVLFVDEAQFFDLLSSPAFEYIVRASPPHVHVMLAAHRPADIPTAVRALSDTWLIFRTSQEHDLKVIRERCGIAVALRVQKIDPRQFIEWDDGEGLAREHLDPRVWFVPLVATSNQPEIRLISGGIPTKTQPTVDLPLLDREE